MNKSMTSLAAALLVSLAACDRTSAPSAREPVWELGRHGVFLVSDAGPARFVRLEGWQWVAPPYACPPDVALGPEGEAVVTSNVVPVLWRVDPQTLAVSVHPLELDADTDKDVGFSALVYSLEEGAYLGVSETQRSLWRISRDLTRAEKMTSDSVASSMMGDTTCAIN